MRADRPGMDETLRLVDRRTVGQRYYWADPWGGHQPPAHQVAADHLEQHLVQDGELLAHDPADAEQRLDDRGLPRVGGAVRCPLSRSLPRIGRPPLPDACALDLSTNPP